MKYSEERIGRLAIAIHDRLYLDNDADYTDEEASLMLIKKTLADFFAIEDRIDDVVTKKLMSLKRNLVPGSREWDIMYEKYFDEEMRKHG